MRRLKWLQLALGLVLGLGLLGCQADNAAMGDDAPDGLSDKALALLPEDWQWLADWQQAEEPPRLLLLYDGTCVEPLLCSRSWAQQLPNGEMAQYIACGAHPLELQAEMPHLAHPKTAEEGKVELVWQAQPTSFGAVAYDYTWWEKRQGLDLGLMLDDVPKSQMSPPGNTLQLFMDASPSRTVFIMDVELGCYEQEIPPGSYLYVVWAEWQTDAEAGPGGYAEWAFFVE